MQKKNCLPAFEGHFIEKDFLELPVGFNDDLLIIISGILHKGDGSNIYLKEKPQELVSILGNGIQRKPDCALCNGDASTNQVRAPVALASGSDGSLYIWDDNFIRKLSPGRTEIVSILKTE